MTTTENRHTVTMLVENQPGVLSRVVGLFSGRGYNIESLCVAPSFEDRISRITLVTTGTTPIIEQIMKQLRKLINVVKVRDITGQPAIQREMALICVNAKPENREEILRIADIFHCKIVDVGAEQYTLEVIGHEEKLDALIALLKPMGIRKLARTGPVALFRESGIGKK